MQTEKNRSILVLEDDPHWQKVVVQILRKMDRVSVQCVQDANEAQTLIDAGSQYDLIVADHFLEGQQTGLEFFHELRHRKNSTSFVLVSSLDRAEFSNLEAEADESPYFVAKSEAANLLGDLVRDQFANVSLPFEPSTQKDVKVFALLAVSALASIVVHSQATKLVRTLSETPQTMNPTKFYSETPPVLVNPRVKSEPRISHAPASKGTPSFVNAALRAQVARITHRAAEIDKDVVKKASAAATEGELNKD